MATYYTHSPQVAASMARDVEQCKGFMLVLVGGGRPGTFPVIGPFYTTGAAGAQAAELNDIRRQRGRPGSWQVMGS